MPLEQYRILSKEEKQKNFARTIERTAEYFSLFAQGGTNGVALRGSSDAFRLEHLVSFFPNETDPKIRFVVFSDPSREDEVWESLEELTPPKWNIAENPNLAQEIESKLDELDLPTIVLMYGKSLSNGNETISMIFPMGMTPQEAFDGIRISVGRYGAFGGN